MRTEIARKLKDNFNSPRELLLFGRIFLLITVLPLLVRFLTLPRLMKFLSRRTRDAPGNRSTGEYVHRAVKFTDYILSRNFWIYRKTCLKRSLVLYHFLQPAVGDLGVCFGVRRGKKADDNDQKELDGHAWLVQRGECFLEEEPDLTRKFIVTYRFPEKPSARKTSGKDFAHLSCENRLLLYCSRADVPEGKASELNYLLRSRMNWEFISQAARSHNVRELLYHNLKRLSNRGFIPAVVMEDLKQAYHETIARNMYIYAELRTILDAFHRAGLEAIALKGAALAGVVYPDIGLRPMADIDLLVREEELAVADRVMTDLEYSAVHNLDSRQWERENHFHLPAYRHARKPVVVEIHWHFTANRPSADIREWWKRALCRDIMGYSILVPSPEDMLIHLAVHLFNHGYDNGFVLRGLCDIFEMLRHHDGSIDWSLVADEIKKQGIGRQVHSVFHLARKFYAIRNDSLMPLSLDQADHRFLRVLERSLFVSGRDAPINPHLLKSMMFDSFRARTRYLLSRIFLPRREMSGRYAASPFSTMVFLHYLSRPFHLLARYGKSSTRIWRGESDEKE